MLVQYSSSSEEDDVAETGSNKSFYRKSPEEGDGEGSDDGCPVKKRARAEQRLTKTRLPIPDCLLSMLPDELNPETEDSSLHSGRIRSFKHERGNWATHVYFPYPPEEEFEDMLKELLSAASAHGVGLTRQDEFHLSLSQTVVLRHHWIQPFTQSLRSDVARCKREMCIFFLETANTCLNKSGFVCTARKLKVYSNAEKTRTFLGMEVSSGHIQLLDLVKVVDRALTEFRLDTFYKEPSFHVSLAWCVGDLTAQLEGCIQELQHMVDKSEDGPFLLALDCVALYCKTGNKTFRFPLDP